MMQSRAGVVNTDYPAQKAVRAALAEGEPVADRIAYAAARALCACVTDPYTGERKLSKTAAGGDLVMNVKVRS